MWKPSLDFSWLMKRGTMVLFFFSIKWNVIMQTFRKREILIGLKNYLQLALLNHLSLPPHYLLFKLTNCSSEWSKWYLMFIYVLLCSTEAPCFWMTKRKYISYYLCRKNRKSSVNTMAVLKHFIYFIMKHLE